MLSVIVLFFFRQWQHEPYNDFIGKIDGEQCFKLILLKIVLQTFLKSNNSMYDVTSLM